MKVCHKGILENITTAGLIRATWGGIQRVLGIHMGGNGKDGQSLHIPVDTTIRKKFRDAYIVYIFIEMPESFLNGWKLSKVCMNMWSLQKNFGWNLSRCFSISLSLFFTLPHCLEASISIRTKKEYERNGVPVCNV